MAQTTAENNEEKFRLLSAPSSFNEGAVSSVIEK